MTEDLQYCTGLPNRRVSVPRLGPARRITVQDGRNLKPTLALHNSSSSSSGVFGVAQLTRCLLAPSLFLFLCEGEVASLQHLSPTSRLKSDPSASARIACL